MIYFSLLLIPIAVGVIAFIFFKGTNYQNPEYSWDDDGVCVCEDDQNPFDNCYYFELDNPEDYEEE